MNGVLPRPPARAHGRGLPALAGPAGFASAPSPWGTTVVGRAAAPARAGSAPRVVGVRAVPTAPPAVGVAPASSVASAPAGPWRRAFGFLRTMPDLVMVTAVALYALDGVFTLVGLRSVKLSAIVLLAVLRALSRAWLRPGFLSALQVQRAGGRPTIATVTGGLDRFGSALVALLVGDGVIAASLAVGALPGITLAAYGARLGSKAVMGLGLVLVVVGAVALYLYAWLGVRFAEHVIALEGRSAWAALERAWRLAEGRRAAMARMAVEAAGVETMGTFAGLAAFGVGLLLGAPLARVAVDHAWLDAFDAARAADSAKAG